MARLIQRGHRVLIYSQFTRTLDILEDWLSGRNWGYQRIDGSIAGGFLFVLLLLGLLCLLFGWGYQSMDGSIAGGRLAWG